MLKTLCTTAVVSTIAIGSTAQAGDSALLEMTVLRNFITDPPAWNDTILGEDGNNDGIFEYGDQSYEDPLGAFAIDYNVVYAGDENVFLTFGITNNTGGDETFTVIADVPLLSPILGTGTLLSGDVEGSVADSNLDGVALLTDSGQAMYQGLVDSNAELSLLDAPFGLSSPLDSTDFGPFAATSVPGPPSAATSIGIAITFTLTDGDTANFTANFSIADAGIPAPGAIALLGVAGLAGTRRRRRS